MCDLLAERLNSCLNIGLLCVHVEFAFTLTSDLTELVCARDKLVEILEVSGVESTQGCRDLLDKRATSTVNLEKVARGVASNVRQLACAFCQLLDEGIKILLRVVRYAITGKICLELLAREY